MDRAWESLLRTVQGLSSEDLLALGLMSAFVFIVIFGLLTD